jgi:hypothetical protein
LIAPPIDEQRRIVERLDEIDKRCGAATAHLARTRAILINFRRSVLAAACAGRLTENWRTETGAVVTESWLGVLTKARTGKVGRGRLASSGRQDGPAGRGRRLGRRPRSAVTGSAADLRSSGPSGRRTGPQQRRFRARALDCQGIRSRPRWRAELRRPAGRCAGRGVSARPAR